MGLHRYGITANAIAPVARTRMSANVPSELAEMGDPEDIVSMVGVPLSEQAKHITGQGVHWWWGPASRSGTSRPKCGRCRLTAVGPRRTFAARLDDGIGQERHAGHDRPLWSRCGRLPHRGRSWNAPSSGLYNRNTAQVPGGAPRLERSGCWWPVTNDVAAPPSFREPLLLSHSLPSLTGVLSDIGWYPTRCREVVRPSLGGQPTRA